MPYLLASYFRFARAPGVTIVFVNKTLWSTDSGVVQQCEGKFRGGRVLLLGKSWKMTSLKGHRTQSNVTGCLADWDQPLT